MTSFEIGLIIINTVQFLVSVFIIIHLIHRKNKFYDISSKELRTFINTLEIDISKFKNKNTFKKEK